MLTLRQISVRRLGIALTILAAATLVRAYHLGRSSFWYDEVVTIRLARTDGPSSLVELLDKIDATRAPLHPLLLQAWVKVFGPSEGSGRGFSLVCGVLTVALISRLGTRLFGDEGTGHWAAWLAAFSPMLVLYSRETRMYAWLVLVTCAAWDALLSLRGTTTIRRPVLYVVGMVALGYSHPLGLVMMATLGLAALVHRRALGLSWRGWIACHLAAAMAVAPWVGRYLDHAPEWTVGRLPIKFLLGLPIGFIGGDFLTLAGFSALIVFGISRRDRREDGRVRLAIDQPVAVSCLLIWFFTPPLLLYAYSRVAHPIFGPARYTLFVAPAYLILVGRGLSKLPRPAAMLAGLGATSLSIAMLPGLVFAPDRTSDWRAAAAALDRLDPSAIEPVVVVTTDAVSDRTVIETARYYLGPLRPIVAMSSRRAALDRPVPRVWFAIAVRDGRVVGDLPKSLLTVAPLDFIGLRLIPADPEMVRVGDP
jgi:hypothetical protein